MTCCTHLSNWMYTSSSYVWSPSCNGKGVGEKAIRWRNICRWVVLKKKNVVKVGLYHILKKVEMDWWMYKSIVLDESIWRRNSRSSGSSPRPRLASPHLQWPWRHTFGRIRSATWWSRPHPTPCNALGNRGRTQTQRRDLAFSRPPLGYRWSTCWSRLFVGIFGLLTVLASLVDLFTRVFSCVM